MKDKYPQGVYEETWVQVNRRLVPTLTMQEQHDLVHLEQQVLRSMAARGEQWTVDMSRELLAKLAVVEVPK